MADLMGSKLTPKSIPFKARVSLGIDRADH